MVKFIVKLFKKFFHKNAHNLYSAVFFSLGGFVTIAICTYSPTDNSIFYIDSARSFINNWAGHVGANVAAFLVYLLGYSVYLLMPLMFYMGYLLARKRFFKQVEKVASIILLMVCSSVIIAFDDKTSAGFIGLSLKRYLLRYTDAFLLRCIMYVAIFIAFILITQLNYQLLFRFVCKLYEFAKPLLYYIQQGALVMVRPAKAAIVWVQSLINGSILKDPQGDIEYGKAEIDTFWASYFESQLPALETELDIHATAPMPSVEKINKPKLVITMEAEENYILPSLDIFTAVKDVKEDKKFLALLEEQAKVLESKLEKFGVFGKVTAIEYGPVVTLFEYQPEADSKLSKIIALEDDLAMALEATAIRILAPIPGKAVVGFEVANKNPRNVYFASLINSPEFKDFKGTLPLILGEDTIGKKIIVDLAKMPHLLVAGSTGSGKSVALNAMITTLLCKHDPEYLKLVLIDPKRLEFASYQDVAHLLFPIVTQPKNSVDVLKWLVKTMEDRYEHMAACNVKNINDFHNLSADAKKEMPFIVLIIDELADLMMTTGKDIEMLIARIAQMARAAGIHMIVATQRPSVDVITGLIKVNFPSRISFRVTSKVDSRTILDCMGAEKLLGRGDSLFLDSGASSLMRVHCAYIATKEINSVVEHIKQQKKVDYIELNQVAEFVGSHEQHSDALLMDIVSYIKTVDEVSISLLQRKFRIGYNRSARIMEMLEEQGYILPSEGAKMRKVVKSTHV